LIKASTLPELLREAYQKYQSTSRFSIPVNGIEKTESISDFYPSICHLSQCLQNYGLQRGDKVALISSGSPDWIRCDIAIQLCGAVTVPLFPDLSEEIFKYEIEHAECKAIICLSESSMGITRKHQQLVSFTISKLNNTINESTYDLDSILNTEYSISDALKYGDKAIEALNENDLVTIIYTSGSTGYPKGVELTHKNLCFEICQTQKRFPLDAEKDIILSCLPLAHIFEKMVIYFYISCGVHIHFVDNINNVGDYLKKIKPSVITLVPRLLEKVYAKMFEKITEAPPLKKALGTWAFNMAINNDFSKNKPSLYPLAKKLVLSQLKLAFGGNIRLALSGGAALNQNLNIFFNNIGIPLYQGYGLTESSPVICANYPNNNKTGTVGKVFPNIELKIDRDTNEICSRGKHIMQAYHKDPESTAATVIDGWLHTGDCGKIDSDGYLTITGRIKEIVKTSNGKYVSPVPIEQQLCTSPLIDMAMVVAESRNFCSCLIFLDPVTLEHYIEKHRLKLSKDDLIKSQDFLKQIQEHIDQCNTKLNHWENIQKFSIIPNAISIQSGELTPTMKIKRHFIEKKYKHQIDNLYNIT